VGPRPDGRHGDGRHGVEHLEHLILAEAGRLLLRSRLRNEGWDQGSRISADDVLYLAHGTDHLTPAAAQAAAQAGAHTGQTLAVLAQQDAPRDGAVLISQRCDIVADLNAEPLVEAVAILRWPDDRALPQPNSVRLFTLDDRERLVADARWRLQFEKPLLPSGSPRQLVLGDRARTFAAWCARRYHRHPFPDAFNETVGQAIAKTWTRPRHGDEVTAAMFPWRVLMSGPDGHDVALLIPYDEDRVSAQQVKRFLDPYAETLQLRLKQEIAASRARQQKRETPALVPGYNVALRPVPSGKLSYKVMRKAPPFNLEHLTYRDDEVSGLEPNSEFDD